jgi:hypothetical protein
MGLKDIITVAISMVALIVSITTLVLNYRNQRKGATLGRKPVLIFEYQRETGWTLRNIGNGPALDVVVAQRLKGEWFNPVRVPPLSKDGKMTLGWLGHVNNTGLGSIYADTEGLPYTVICGKDRNTHSDGLSIGPWRESDLGKHWNHPRYEAT